MVGPGQGDQIVAAVGPALENAVVFPVEGGTVEAALELTDGLRTGSFDAVVGIGGGRTLDVAKYAAGLAGLPMVTVATNLSHDGIASPVASLEHDGRKGSYGVHGPIAVIVDLDYVRRSPPEQLRAGIGDALSNLSALADWELAGRERGEQVDGLAAAFARAGAESLLSRTDDLHSDTFLTALSEALVLSGLAMAAAGSSRPCSGACHEISHAIDALFPGRRPARRAGGRRGAVRLVPAERTRAWRSWTLRFAATRSPGCRPTSASRTRSSRPPSSRRRRPARTASRSSSTSTSERARSNARVREFTRAFDR